MALNWFSTVRAIFRLRTEWRETNRQLKRIADAMEGVTPARDLPPDQLDRPTQTETLPPVNYRDAWEVEQKLTKDLGREPTPEEVVAALDQAPPDEWPVLREPRLAGTPPTPFDPPA